ncbi:MAG TPA: hypothetical protein VN441_17790 [Syntrophomonas sp.]|nr:hypothetical protein [Syntrophomonas sp.]
MADNSSPPAVNILYEAPCAIDLGPFDPGAQHHYLTAIRLGGLSGACLNTDADTIGEREQFEFVSEAVQPASSNPAEIHITPDPDFVKIKTCFGNYVSIVTYENKDRGNLQPLHTDAVHIKEWERFVVCLLDNYKVAIRTPNGKYLSASATGATTPICLSDASKASKFELLALDEQKGLPDMSMHSYEIVSANFLLTKNSIVDYVLKAKGNSFPLQYLNTATEYGFMTEISLGFTRMPGAQSIYSAAGKHAAQITQAITSVELGYAGENIVMICLYYNKNGRPELCCSSQCLCTYDKVPDKIKRIAAPNGFALAGLVPQPGAGENGALRELHCFFRSVAPASSDSADGSDFLYQSVHDEHFFSYSVRSNSAQSANKALSLEISTCSPVFNAYGQCSDYVEQSKETVSFENRVSISEFTCGASENIRMFGALSDAEDTAFYPEGVELAVFDNDDQPFAFEASESRFVLCQDENVSHYAEDSPSGNTYIFMLSVPKDADFFFEHQVVSDGFSAEKGAQILADENVVFPVLGRPRFKMCAVLSDPAWAENKSGGRQLQGFFSTFATLIATACGVTGSTAVLIAGGILVAAAAAAIYIGVSIYRSSSSSSPSLEVSSEEKATVDDLMKKIAEKKTLFNDITDEYNQYSAIRPENRSYPTSSGRPVTYLRIKILVFEEISYDGYTYRVDNTQISFMQDAVKKFTDYISQWTSYHVGLLVEPVAVIYKNIDITDSRLPNLGPYLKREKIGDVLRQHAPFKDVDCVFAVHAGGSDCGYYGLTHNGLTAYDAQAFFTFNISALPQTAEFHKAVFTHEFLHYYEGIRNILENIVFPSPDNAEATQPEFPNFVRKPEYSSGDNYLAYYQDMVQAAVPYNPPAGATKYVGLFPAMQRLTPHALEIGVYKIKHYVTKQYLTADNAKGTITLQNKSDQDSQKWLVRYVHSGEVMITSCADSHWCMDVDNADYSKNLHLSGELGYNNKNFPNFNYFKHAQRFIISENAGGTAKISSTVNHPYSQPPVVQMENQAGLWTLKLGEDKATDNQKWIFEMLYQQVIHDL